MKNITQYFVDTVKSSESTVCSNGNTIEETKSKKGSKEKSNRVKSKITRINTRKRICDIIESNDDIIDKTPDLFTKVKDKDKNSHEIPKSSSSSKLSSQKLQNQDVDYLSLEIKDAFKNKLTNRNKKQNFQNSLSNIENYKAELRNEKDMDNDISLNSVFKNNNDIDIIDLQNTDSSDTNEYYHEESNAFQIIMSRNKPMQSPTKFLSQTEETNTTNSEEYREKLKRSKERLIALADKKGYSKRKLLQIEEGEKMERIIQNRIKTFKREEKKDNVGTSVLNQKQPHGNLLDYFR